MATLDRVTDRAARLILRGATVTHVVDHGRLRTITVAGDELCGVAWRAGDKIRVRVESRTLRTYTPVAWNTRTGTAQFVVHLTGSGPGSRWCAAATPGTSCQFLGPARSLRVDQLSAPPIFVGDETSIGLVTAWRNTHEGLEPAAIIYEVESIADTQAALAHHGNAHAIFVGRTAKGEHRDMLADHFAIARRAHPDAPVCFSGCAQTIASLRRVAKETLRDVPAPATTLVKAYWDERRTGLD